MPNQAPLARLLALLFCLPPALGAADAAGQERCARPDDAALTEALERQVTAEGVDYAGLRKSKKLMAYLSSVERMCPAQLSSLPKAEQLAFWINAYNAAVLSLIAKHAPVSSIREISEAPGGVFKHPLLRAGDLVSRPGESLSLDEVETVIRQFGDPRIHFALVCGARSCPALRRSAYSGARLDLELDEVTRGFLGDPSKNQLRPVGGVVRLSKIFDWYRDDFGPGPNGIAQWLRRYAPELGADGGAPKIEFLEYDWRLNDR